MTMDLRKTLPAVLAALLAGCTGGARDDDILGQVEETLSATRTGCSVTAEYGGVGEGDADTAYVTVALRRQDADPGVPRRDVELMFSRHDGGRWVMTGESAGELKDAATGMCLESKRGVLRPRRLG